MRYEVEECINGWTVKAEDGRAWVANSYYDLSTIFRDAKKEKEEE